MYISDVYDNFMSLGYKYTTLEFNDDTTTKSISIFLQTLKNRIIDYENLEHYCLKSTRGKKFLDKLECYLMNKIINDIENNKVVYIIEENNNSVNMESNYYYYDRENNNYINLRFDECHIQEVIEALLNKTDAIYSYYDHGDIIGYAFLLFDLDNMQIMPSGIKKNIFYMMFNYSDLKCSLILPTPSRFFDSDVLVDLCEIDKNTLILNKNISDFDKSCEFLKWLEKHNINLDDFYSE